MCRLSFCPEDTCWKACEVLGTRLNARGCQVQYIRGEGAPGDSDRYPRWNVIARREGRALSSMKA